MLPTLLLTSSILVAGGPVFHDRAPGPASSNTDLFTAPRVGLSSMEEVVRMWGEPASRRVEKNHAICSWTRGRVTAILTFNTRLDCLVDRKIVKNQ